MPNSSHQLQSLSLPNGKVERSHRIDDEEFWHRYDFDGLQDAEPSLREWEHRYNYERFSLALDGRTPGEKLRHKQEVAAERVALDALLSERARPLQYLRGRAQRAAKAIHLSGPSLDYAVHARARAHPRRRATGRRPLPAHLPRHRREIDVPNAAKVCGCGRAKTRIGETVSEKLEYVTASLFVVETARLKYACPQCHEGVVEAAAPPQAVEKSLAGEGLSAVIRESPKRSLKTPHPCPEGGCDDDSPHDPGGCESPGGRDGESAAVASHSRAGGPRRNRVGDCSPVRS